MYNELKELLKNSYAAYDFTGFSAIVETKDGCKFNGVTVKNMIFRDAIYAEQAAIARAVTAGYKYGDIEKIYIMVGTRDINDLKHINRDVLIEFMEPSARVHLYDINGNNRVLKVGNLLFNIY